MSRRRRNNGAQPGHTDDWLITYADTITLLLCLFVVLLALQAHSRKLAQSGGPGLLVQQIAHIPDWQPRVPTVTGSTDASPDDEYSSHVSPQREENTPASATAAETMVSPASAEAPAWQPAGSASTAAIMPDRDPTAVFKVPPTSVTGTQVIGTHVIGTQVSGTHVSGAGPGPMPESPAEAQPGGAAQPDRQGDRITILALDSTALFGRGSATLNSQGKVILQEVVGSLKSDEYRDYKITIEGHTDDAPVATSLFPSNWELSTARAAAVVRYFIEQGVLSQRLRAAGYADTQPLLPNRSGDGLAIADNQAKNRRVVIVMEKLERR